MQSSEYGSRGERFPNRRHSKDPVAFQYYRRRATGCALGSTLLTPIGDHTANNPADDFPRKYLKNYSASSSIYSRDDTPNDTSSYAPDQSASDSHDKSLRGKTASSSVYSRDDLPEVVPESSSKDINAPSHSNDVTETFKDKSTDSGNGPSKTGKYLARQQGATP